MYDVLVSIEICLLRNDVKKLVNTHSTKGWNSSWRYYRLICCRFGLDKLVPTSAIGGQPSHLRHVSEINLYRWQKSCYLTVWDLWSVQFNFVMFSGYRGCYKWISNMDQKMSSRILNIVRLRIRRTPWHYTASNILCTMQCTIYRQCQLNLHETEEVSCLFNIPWNNVNAWVLVHYLNFFGCLQQIEFWPSQHRTF
jgi:hypothetical protein